MHVGVWIIVRTLYGVKITMMNTAVFILLGTVPFLLVVKCLPLFINAITSHRQLLKFKQVKPCDFVLSTLLSEALVMICSLLILLFIFRFLEIPWQLYHPENVLYGAWFLFSALLGIGFILAVLGFFFPFIKNFMLLVTRLLYFTSGVFFPASSVPQHVRDVLCWNPLFQVIELIREGFMLRPPSLEFVNQSYLLFFSTIALAFGLATYVAFSARIMTDIEKS